MTRANCSRETRAAADTSPLHHTSRPHIINPALARAQVSRDPAPAAAVLELRPEPSPPKRKTSPSAFEPVISREIRDYGELIGLLRDRANELELSRESIDHIAGLPSGLSSKILSLNHLRRIGVDTMGPMLDLLCLKLTATPDLAALARNKHRFIKRDDAHFRSAAKRHRRPVTKDKTLPKKITGMITATLFGWPTSS